MKHDKRFKALPYDQQYKESKKSIIDSVRRFLLYANNTGMPKHQIKRVKSLTLEIYESAYKLGRAHGEDKS